MLKDEKVAGGSQNQVWIEDGRAIRLLASKDPRTGTCVFPKLPDASPSAHRYERVVLSRNAKVYSYTIIHPGPKTGKPPFALIYADFPEKARVMGRLRLPADQKPAIGMTVSVEVEKAADGSFQYVFVPAKG